MPRPLKYVFDVQVEKHVDKQVYVSLTDHDQLTKIRDLDAGTISQLTTITGQVCICVI